MENYIFTDEWKKYIQDHDFDENEMNLIEEWASSGHGPFENPHQEYDDYGKQVPLMRWYYIQTDEHHPENNRKMFLKEAMRKDVQFDSADREKEYLKESKRILTEEIITYRRFLAKHKGLVEEYETYRQEMLGGQ